MEKIALPEPETAGGKPLMDVIRERYSCKNINSQPLDDQQLSNLLWAAFGVNRPESGKRTAPSARNIQEMKVYVVLAEGAYVYDPVENCLNPVASGDIRTKSSVQPNYKDAPVHLAFVADFRRYVGSVDVNTQERFKLFSHCHAGFIGQNVYLYCASIGLGSCFVASFDQEGLAQALGLGEDQFLLYTQIIGYPAN